MDVTQGGGHERGSRRSRRTGASRSAIPRKDGGEEINARFTLRDRPMSDLRHAFELDDWPVDGKVSGEFRLYDKYTRPFGYGRLSITDATAWGEPFERATAPMRFEGQGVRLDAIEIAKAGGTMTGAAYVGWDGRYSFNVARRPHPARVAGLDQVRQVRVDRADALLGQRRFHVREPALRGPDGRRGRLPRRGRDRGGRDPVRRDVTGC